jgi:hypothetical protein
MLLTQRAYVEGMRALSYWVGLLSDVEEKHPDADRRAEAEDLVALMTPIIKAFLTDVGVEVTNLALQCYGGHGYIREFGMEQFVRDARIAQIYEGTNGVQAMDLVGRKMPEDDGRLVKRFFALAQADVERALAGDDELARDLATQLGRALQSLQETTVGIATRARKDPNELGAAAVDYLRQFGLVATGWMWLRMAVAASAKLAAGDGDGHFLEGKRAVARFYFARLLPQARALQSTIGSGAGPVMDGAL